MKHRVFSTKDPSALAFSLEHVNESRSVVPLASIMNICKRVSTAAVVSHLVRTLCVVPSCRCVPAAQSRSLVWATLLKLLVNYKWE